MAKGETSLTQHGWYGGGGSEEANTEQRYELQYDGEHVSPETRPRTYLIESFQIPWNEETPTGTPVHVN